MQRGLPISTFRRGDVVAQIRLSTDAEKKALQRLLKRIDIKVYSMGKDSQGARINLKNPAGLPLL